MKRHIYFTFCFLLLIQYTFAQKKKEKEAILNVLSSQEKAWNSGDINEFMNSYWKNDSLAFVGSKKVTYGWDNTLKNYQKGYPDTIKMGKLHFDIIRLDLLDSRNAFVIGAWHLERSIGNIGGHFTLLFRKIKDRWVIIVDHTS